MTRVFSLRISRFDSNLFVVSRCGRNFEAPLFNLALFGKFLGVLIWDTFYRIVVSSLSRQTPKSRQNKIYSRICLIYVLALLPWRNIQEQSGVGFSQRQYLRLYRIKCALPAREQAVRSLLRYAP